MKQKHLSSKEKSRILTLSASGKSATAVAEQIKRNPRTVRKFLDEPNTKELLADKFERLCREILDSVKPEDILKSNLTQKAIAAGIFTDKMQVLKGQPTSINVSLMLDAVEMIREMRDQSRTTLPQLRNASDATLPVVEGKEN